MTAAHRILLVDDDPDDRALAVAVLRSRRSDLTVAEAGDGVSFAGHLARGNFDVVVTEHRLSWGDGLRLLDTVKDLHPDRAVVLFTAEAGSETVSRAVRGGVDGIVPKSSSGFLELASLVVELLEGRSAAGGDAVDGPSREPPSPRRVDPEPTPFPGAGPAWRSAHGPGDGRRRAAGGGPPAPRLTPVARPAGGHPPSSSPPSPAEDIVHALSHDLQEPVQLVTRYARLRGERYGEELDGEGERHLGHLVRSAERLQSMLDDLLDVARSGAGGREHERVDLEAVVDEALETLHGPIEETGARVTRDPLPTVEADRSQMVRLFQNLIGNAIKFHGENPPEIHVRAAAEDDLWVLEVQDNGIGIAEEDRERIFEVFERLHTADEIPGTGVGLAICRRIAQGHGGTLTVESTPGRGSTFTLALPREATP